MRKGKSLRSNRLKMMKEMPDTGFASDNWAKEGYFVIVVFYYNKYELCYANYDCELIPYSIDPKLAKRTIFFRE